MIQRSFIFLAIFVISLLTTCGVAKILSLDVNLAALFIGCFAVSVIGTLFSLEG